MCGLGIWAAVVGKLVANLTTYCCLANLNRRDDGCIQKSAVELVFLYVAS